MNIRQQNQGQGIFPFIAQPFQERQHLLPHQGQGLIQFTVLEQGVGGSEKFNRPFSFGGNLGNGCR